MTVPPAADAFLQAAVATFPEKRVKSHDRSHLNMTFLQTPVLVTLEKSFHIQVCDGGPTGLCLNIYLQLVDADSVLLHTKLRDCRDDLNFGKL